MIPDTVTSLSPSRLSPSRLIGRRARASRLATPRPISTPAAWSISGGQLVNAHGQRFRVARHGLDKYRALLMAKDATVLYGEFPDLVEITTDRDRIDAAINQVSTRGELFSVYASVYRSGSRLVLLLDYLR